MKKLFGILLGILIVVVIGGYSAVDAYKNDIYDSVIEMQASELGLQQKTIAAGGFQWAYFESVDAGDKPVMVLLHGFGSSKETWLDISPYLKDYFHLVIPDLPGHGKSSFDNSKRYNLNHQGEMLRSFFSVIGLKQYHLMGNSMGGGISGYLAGSYPQQVLSATLLDPAGIVEYRSEYQDLLDQGTNLLILENIEQLDYLFEFAVAEKKEIPWPFNEVLLQRAIDSRPAIQKIFSDVIANPEYDYKQLMRDMAVPTLVLWGKEDRIINPKNAAEYQKLNSAIDVRLLDNVGHIPMVEIPERCAKLMLGFLAAHKLQ